MMKEVLFMKTIVSVGPGKSVLREVPMPEINENQILIRVKYVGVCMSEHYGWAHAEEGDAFGHEPLGIVEKVGANVKGYQPGDRVSGWWGSTLPGAGGMVEYAVGDPEKDTILILPDNVNDEDMLLEPLSCMMSAVSKVRIPMPGTEVCVVGAGYMGCGLISLLKLRGAIVTAVDKRPESRANAKKYGADFVLSVEEAEEMLAKGFAGFPAVMEWGENNDSLDLAARMTAQCGQLCIGAYHTGEKRLINMELLNVRAIDCLSTHPRELHLSIQGAKNAVRMLSEGRWGYLHIPTMIYPMDQFDRAQAELETKYGHHMKAIIDMTKLTGEPVLYE